jgi:hypothetical protein
MAFFDFLKQPIGGYKQQSVPPIPSEPVDVGGLQTLEGANTAAIPATGMTWGQLLGAAMQYGSRSPSSQLLGGLAMNQYQLPGQQMKVQPLQPVPVQTEQDASSDMGDIAAIAGFFGFGL